MGIFLVILLTIAFFIIGGIIFAASRQPNEFRVSRSALLNATPAAVFEHVNDLEKWQTWSPWAKMDPQAQTSFEGPKAGVGARFSWNGKKIGKGTMTILESTPSSFVKFELEFFKPLKGINTTEFTFKPEGEGEEQHTYVTWKMYGPANIIHKVMGLFMNCGKIVSDQFDSGLANLGTLLTPDYWEGA